MKPFYIKAATTKDISVCCCKLHLEARWCIDALIKICKDQNTPVEIINYTKIFEHLTAECGKNDHAYIDWDCTPNKETICMHVQNSWRVLSKYIKEKIDGEACVSMAAFKMQTYKKKNGQEAERLEQIKVNANITNIIDTIIKLLPKIIHHRNLLKNYRNTIAEFRDINTGIMIDIDFSEKLKVISKQEAQSQHWNQKGIIVHSGIMQEGGVKSYHAHLSDDRFQDQVFVNHVLDKMLEESSLKEGDKLIIESDNCTSQYKCAEHFSGLQDIARKYKVTVIRVYGVAGHGKGDVDHVGGLAKVCVRREIVAGEALYNSEDMVECLKNKFGDSESPLYFFKEITSEELERGRKEALHHDYKSIKRSSFFQVVILFGISINYIT